MFRISLVLSAFCVICHLGCSSTASSDSPVVDIYPSVTVTSSSVLEDEGVRFVPQWAIDRVESRLWSNCFVSKQEPNPWWRLDLGKRETIRNFWIDTRIDDSNHQPNVKLSDMNGLTVYVDDVSDTAGMSHTQQCGSALAKTPGRRISFTCFQTGRYIHVINLSSSQPKYLVICEVFINYAQGSRVLFSSLQVEKSTVQPGEDSTKPFTLAFDDIRSTCASTNTPSTSQSWSFHLSKPLFVYSYRVYLNYKNGGTYELFDGTQLVNDGIFPKFSSTRTSNQNGASLRRFGLFVQYFTITLTSSTPLKLEVCELELTGAPILDIYSSSVATASTQLSPSNLMSKAIDKSLQTTPESCYRSTQQANAWWRLELANPTAIGYVVITTMPDNSLLSEMDGFSVYIGNKTTNSGRDNEQCGSPWMKPASVVSNVSIECAGQPIGKYLYIVADNRSSASLSLCEVQIYNCKGSNPVVSAISGDVDIDVSEETTLNCMASGCPTPSIVWTDPDGHTATPTSHVQSGSHVTSTLKVSGSGGGGNYTCIAYNGRTDNATSQIVVSVFSIITQPPKNTNLYYGQTAILTCKAMGYPIPVITWTSPTDSSFMLMIENFSSDPHALTSKIRVSGSGGNFTCKASNGKGRSVTAKATVFTTPHVTVLSPRAQAVVEGSAVNVTVCIARGYPKPSIVWKQPGRGIPPQSRQYTNHSASYISGRNLTLGKAQYNQLGVFYFTCEASNPLGSASDSFALTVTAVRCSVLQIPFGGFFTIPSQYRERVKFQCHKGYHLIGPSSATCRRAGTWSETPACLPVKCGRPALFKHVIANSTEFVYPNVIGFKCPPGYIIEGPKHTQCQASRTWSRSSPRCLKKDFPCGYPPHLPDSTLLTNWNTAEYTCDNGLQPEKQTITCLENGQWSKPLHQCRSPTCSIPELLPYGAVTFNFRERSGVAQYTCGVCYSLIGNKERRCQLMDDGKSLEWSGIPPTCTIVRCGSAPELENGSVNFNKNGTCGSVAIYKCDSGFLLLGNDHLVCTPDGVWSGLKPNCVVWRS